MLNNQHIEFNGITDEINWKLSNDGFYLAKLAYKMQFLGAYPLPDTFISWKPWARPKCKVFCMVDSPKPFWTAHRLEKGGWKIVEFASFAIKWKNRRTTSSSNVVSSLGCGAP
jgi:hypothetical protein